MRPKRNARGEGPGHLPPGSFQHAAAASAWAARAARLPPAWFGAPPHDAHRYGAPTRAYRLQWGRDPEVAEGRVEAIRSAQDEQLQWGRDPEVAEGVYRAATDAGED